MKTLPMHRVSSILRSQEYVLLHTLSPKRKECWEQVPGGFGKKIGNIDYFGGEDGKLVAKKDITGLLEEGSNIWICSEGSMANERVYDSWECQDAGLIIWSI